MAAHKEAVAVYSIRCARKKRAVILTFSNFKLRNIIRLNNYYLINLIGERLVKNIDNEGIAYFKLI